MDSHYKSAAIILILTITVAPSVLSQKSFAEPCDPAVMDKSQICDGDLGLNCTEEHKLCECKNLRDAQGASRIVTVWSQGVCRVRLHELCSFKRAGVLTEYGCLHNGHCVNNTCSCKRGYKPNLNGTVCKNGVEAALGSSFATIVSSSLVAAIILLANLSMHA